MNAIIITNGTPEEIAALVLAVQERRGLVCSVRSGGKMLPEAKTKLSDTIRSILLDMSSVQDQSPQPEPKEHTPNQGGAPRPQEPLP